jgi:hypothetical protein
MPVPRQGKPQRDAASYIYDMKGVDLYAVHQLDENAWRSSHRATSVWNALRSSMHAGPPEGLDVLPCPVARDRTIEPIFCRSFGVVRRLAAAAKHPEPPAGAELVHRAPSGWEPSLMLNRLPTVRRA